MVAHHLSNLARSTIEGKETFLEDLNPVKAGCRYRCKLLVEISRNRNSCNGPLHTGSLDSLMVRS